MSLAVIAGCDAPPIFEPSEHVFDFMPLTIEYFIVGNVRFTVLLWWNAWLYAFGSKAQGFQGVSSIQYRGVWL